MFRHVPTIDEIGVKENLLINQNRKLMGGETIGLEKLARRIEEHEAIISGRDQSAANAKLDFIDYSSSMSAAIALGTISIRRYKNTIKLYFETIIVF